MGSLLLVTDNSGATEAECISPLGKTHERTASIGQTIVVAIRKASPKSSVKDGEVCKAVIVRTAYPIRRPDGSSVRFDDNAIVLVDKKFDLIGTRIFGPVARELRDVDPRIPSLAEEVI